MVQDSDERQDLSPQIVNSDSHSSVNKDGASSFDYEWIPTKDNSLTLKSTLDADSEWMHSLHGAYSESQYIYGEALRLALQDWDTSKPLNILSMGLGLGYLEWIALFECAKIHQKVTIHSFEYDAGLQDLFRSNSQLGLNFVKNDFLACGAEHEARFKISAMDFKQGYFDFFLKDYGSENILDGLSNVDCVVHHGPFEEKSLETLSQKFQVIFYDAFSSSTQSELWSEKFLTQMLTEISDPNHCIFTTYAKVGALNRALKSANFEPQFKKGFAFKRESTLAKRHHQKVPGSF